nr:unnamed protein product [Digitaria exilis]
MECRWIQDAHRPTAIACPLLGATAAARGFILAAGGGDDDAPPPASASCRTLASPSSPPPPGSPQRPAAVKSPPSPRIRRDDRPGHLQIPAVSSALDGEEAVNGCSLARKWAPETYAGPPCQ